MAVPLRLHKLVMMTILPGSGCGCGKGLLDSTPIGSPLRLNEAECARRLGQPVEQSLNIVAAVPLPGTKGAATAAEHGVSAVAKSGNALSEGPVKYTRPLVSIEEFSAKAGRGKIRSAVGQKKDLENILAKNVQAVHFDIIGPAGKFANDYETGRLTKRLEDAGLFVSDDRMGLVFAAQSQKALDGIKSAKTAIEFGRIYGYSEDDIVKSLPILTPPDTEPMPLITRAYRVFQGGHLSRET